MLHTAANSVGNLRRNAGPGGAGQVLADPHPAQHQDEDQLSDQNGLDHRHRGPLCRARAWKAYEPTAAIPRAATAAAGLGTGPAASPSPAPAHRRSPMLRHQVDRIGESSGQGEHHRKRHAPCPRGPHACTAPAPHARWLKPGRQRTLPRLADPDQRSSSGARPVPAKVVAVLLLHLGDVRGPRPAGPGRVSGRGARRRGSVAASI